MDEKGAIMTDPEILDQHGDVISAVATGDSSLVIKPEDVPVTATTVIEPPQTCKVCNKPVPAGYVGTCCAHCFTVRATFFEGTNRKTRRAQAKRR
jgi:predicted nucleic acid-binding Zn ribbon protein